jgi:2-keto-4-pentenoate hydratase/2-oxohepta-3-ene-1,7-dioic acid hydratase in catechol pathway
MKLVTYVLLDGQGAGLDRVGVLAPDGRIVDLGERFASMLELIAGGSAALEVARSALGRAQRMLEPNTVRLRAPLPVPPQMRDAMTFETHYRQGMQVMARMRAGAAGALAARLGFVRIPRVWYEQPTYYKCNRFSVIGPEQDVRWPTGAKLMDYELEIAAVIGKAGKDIARKDALAHVFGYMIYNDMTARDLQEREMRGHLGPAKGKDFDTGNVLGPWLVTADEIDPYGLTMSARVNGEPRGGGHSSSMHHRWDAVIEHIARNETLHAGEVIGSGTVGNGCGLEHGKFLRDGDVIELEVEGLGVLRNRLVKA